ARRRPMVDRRAPVVGERRVCVGGAIVSARRFVYTISTALAVAAFVGSGVANLFRLDHVGHDMARLVARQRGGILLVSSVGGLNGVPYVTNTAAVEAYVLTLGEGLHVELARHGVNVTVLMPGPTLTE